MKKQLLTLSLACLIMLTGCAKQPRPAEPRSPAEPPFLEDSLLDEDASPEVFSEWRSNQRETFEYGQTSEESRGVRHDRGSRENRGARDERQYSGGKVDPKTAGMLVRLAKTTLGTPYVFGGSSRSGFDCSGLVRWTYSHFGINLPRSAAEQAQMGRPIRNQNALQAGDLVTFRHPRRGYHIGIYVGDGKFIHSPQRNKNVTIVSLNDDYFRRIYTGARRLDTDDISDNRLEEVEDLVNAYKEDVGRRKRLADARQNSRGRRDVASRSNSGSGSRTANVRAERRKDRKEKADNPREKRRYSADSRDARRNSSVNRVNSRKDNNRDEARSSKDKRRQQQEARSQQRDRKNDRAQEARQRDRAKDNARESTQRQRDKDRKDNARQQDTRRSNDKQRAQQQNQREKQQPAARQQNNSRKENARKDTNQQRMRVDVRRSNDNKRDDKKRDDKKRDTKK